MRSPLRYALGACIVLTWLMLTAVTRQPPRDACATLDALPRFSPGLPLIIHMQWPESRPLGELQTRVLAAYTRLFPAWKQLVWNDSAIEAFVRTEYNWFYPSWVSFPYQMQRVDLSRYMILHKYGGIYSDLDFEPLHPFAELLDPKRITLPESPLLADEIVRNSFMASAPKHAFWEYVLAETENRRGEDSVSQATGCGMLSRMVVQHQAMINILPCENFMRQSPLSYLDGDIPAALAQKLLYPLAGMTNNCGSYGDPCEYSRHWGA